MNKNVNMKKILTAAEIAAGTALYLMEHSGAARRKVKNFFSDQMDDVRDRAKDTYDAAADRATEFSESFRGSQSNSGGWNVLRFMVGLGVGVGIALLMAPASGEQTRARLSESAREFGDRARRQFSSSELEATGTGD